MTPAIAIVGMACRYPDARSPGQLWENVLAQRRAFRRLPPERLRLEDYLSDDRGEADKIYSPEAALIEGYEFDRVRFRVAGSTFRAADMAHWLALEVAADALADAGFAEADGLPKDGCGVLVGNSLTGEFSRANLMRLRWPYVRRTVDAALGQRGWSAQERGAFLESLEEQYKAPFPPVGDETLAGGLSNTIAGRICNHFDLGGGGYTVDGACASSLLAVATACSSLCAGDLEVALAGGVDLSLDPFELVGFSKIGALATDEMRVYDARSAGFWPGEGCGFVVLMRYEDALAEHRHIYALVRGWGISSDGSGGITRPEVDGQLRALRRAYRRAGFGIDSVAYFEGHGTGTSIGDPTELRALSRARREGAPHGPPAAIGSIKANIGHTKAAAGVAGLLKATMALTTQLLPPSTGAEVPHPVLAEEDHTLRLLRQAEVWPADQPLRAGVSAMGFGGINAHVVLEGVSAVRRKAANPRERALLSAAQDAELFLVSGQDHDTLRRQVRQLLSFASNLSRSELADLAAQLAGTLEREPVRAAIVASSPTELEHGLSTIDSWLADGVQSRLDDRGRVMLGCGVKQPTIGFLFPGQGSPANLSGGAWARRFEFVRDLYARASLPAHGDGIATEVAQPAIVTASLAGLHLLDQLRIGATVAVGHSLGELTAYHWAGAMPQQTLLRVVAARGRAIADFGRPGGAMASIAAAGPTVGRLLLGEPIVLAGLNSPTQTVVSGEAAALDALVSRAKAAGLTAVSLPVSHAFHSPLVADAAPALARAIAAEQLQPLRGAVASTVTGALLDPNDDLGALLFRQMTSPVRFMEAVQAVADRVDLWIEVGPGSVLRRLASHLVDTPVVSLDTGGDSLGNLLQSVGAAFVLGAAVNHRMLFEGRFTRAFDLDWHPRFFVNPCELAPQPESGPPPKKPKSRRVGRGTRPTWAETNEKAEASEKAETNQKDVGLVPRPTLRASRPADASPLEVVRQLAAARAELPQGSVKPDDRLLNDLHLSSLAVGQLVVEAARALGLPPPASPGDAATATVGQVAKALEELAEHGAAGPAHAEEAFPVGVDSWTRTFTVELVARRLPRRKPPVLSGPWRVIAPPDHPLREALQKAFDDRPAGQGVVVCLPPEPARTTEEEGRHVELLLQGAQAALADEAATGEKRIEETGSRLVIVQHGGGAAAFARSLHLELPNVTTCVVDVPPEHPQAVDWILAESQLAVGHCEAYYDDNGTRREPVLRLQPMPDEVPSVPLDADDVMLVTGGGKGITAECAFSLAKETGARLALLGRSRPADDTELAANLERMTAAGINFQYLRADVTDREAVRAAVREVEAHLGPISAVLHGAGRNVPQRLSSLDKDGFLRTLRPKLQGARNVLAAVNPEQLRLLVTFGSIIACTGMHGQADYAVANQWLTRLTERWQTEHPHCHCLAVQWSVWSGVGMGERLGTLDALKQQGVTPIPPDEGIRLLRCLIGHPLPSVGVVVTGRFGEPPTLKSERPELPLLRFLQRPRVHVPGVELVVEADLSADTDPYLKDHVYQGTPLLPAVMGLEAMAQVAMALVGTSKLPVFEQVKFHHPVVVPEGQRVTIRLAALKQESDRVEIVLRSQETGFQMDHFRAICRVGEKGVSEKGVRNLFCGAPEGPFRKKVPDTFLPGNGAAPVPIDPRQDLYGGILFHGGRFRRLSRYHRLRATECIAEIASDGATDWFGQYLPAELVLGDPAARDAVIHAIQACIPHGTLLPIGVDRLVLGTSTTAPITVRAQERSQDGDIFVYDIEVTAVDGDVLERWEGLQLRRVAEKAPDAAWVEPLLGPYIERRLAELTGQSTASVVVEHNGAADRRSRSDRAIRQVLGAPAVVHRRPDGKPEVSCDQEVSVAHAKNLTMAVAGPGPIACDAEPLATRPAKVWRDLLGAERHALAQLIAVQTTEDQDMAATRVWTAAECLKKAGAGLDVPLVLHSTTADGWVLLAAGPLSIGTWGAPVRNTTGRLVLAVLVRNHAGGPSMATSADPSRRPPK